MDIRIPISPGELIDKITILEIKLDNITDKDKLKNVRYELEAFNRVRNEFIEAHSEVTELTTELKKVNLMLWQIEDDIRICEKNGDFGQEFINLARSVYKTNDRRAKLKYRINRGLNSEIIEEKSYEDY